jgi:hypothetical protein
MANQIAKLRLMGDEKIGRIAVPIASATVIPAGQFVSYESGLLVPFDTQNEDVTFIGVAEGQSKAGETDLVSVIVQGVVECSVTSAAYTIGQGLHFNASTGALENATANTIAWSWEDTKGASVTSLKVLVDIVALNKLFPVLA